MSAPARPPGGDLPLRSSSEAHTHTKSIVHFNPQTKDNNQLCLYVES